ncbi:MAG: hypothetical protein ACKVXR_05990 [Planctomycetota bacterium]
MSQPEPTDTFRAGFLMTIGAALGLVGLLLSAGRAAAQEVLFQDAPASVANLIKWGPYTLMAVGGLLALGSGLALSVGWFQKR